MSTNTTDLQWLLMYEREYLDIADEILDEADEYFGFTDLTNEEIDAKMHDGWYLYVIKRHHGVDPLT